MPKNDCFPRIEVVLIKEGVQNYVTDHDQAQQNRNYCDFSSHEWPNTVANSV